MKAKLECAARLAAEEQGSPDQTAPDTTKVRDLNDRFRRTLHGGRVVATAGVFNLGPVRVSEIMAQVRTFDRFGPDNDPHGEHDFGAFDDGGERFFFKIDYCDKELNGRSPDQADPDQTCRVLTVMLASEY